MKIPFLVALLVLIVVHGQQYDEYNDGYAEQDSLYEDYAARQQEKAAAGGGAASGGGLSRFIMGGAVGWLVGGKFHSRRVRKSLSLKHKEEQKKLYQQYYNDVYTLQSQNSELVQALEKIQKQRSSR